ncbi:MAG: magnesium transporter [Planctomycetota bacterium]|nr:MAG: magnesium transporter [Planctomycetota bacterium]
MLGELLQPEIEELIESRNFTALRDAVADLPPTEVADLFADLPPEQVAVVFRILPREKATSVFEYLPVELQESVLRALGQEQVAAVLNEMAPDDRTALLEEMPGEAAQRLIGLLSPEERRVAVKLLGYPEESIGRRMTPDYVAVRKDWSISHVFSHLRQVGRAKETLNVVFVTDERGHLLDDIRLRDLVLADPNERVSDIMDGHYFYLRAHDDQEVAVRAFKKYDRSALPVVDSSNVLVGILTVDDVLDVAEQEETEDVQKMAAVQVLDEPYLDVTAMTMVRKRAPWLFLLFCGEMLTITAMHNFESTLERVVILAAFIPLIISSGGNSGSQAASLVIRALAIGELTLADWWRVMRRELASGLMFGSILGLSAFVAAYALGLYRVSKGQAPPDGTLLVAFVVGTALVGVVLFGTLTGSMLPILLKRLGFDPAVSSTPFVATLVDVTGILIYFATALFLLRGTLL